MHDFHTVQWSEGPRFLFSSSFLRWRTLLYRVSVRIEYYLNSGANTHFLRWEWLSWTCARQKELGCPLLSRACVCTCVRACGDLKSKNHRSVSRLLPSFYVGFWSTYKLSKRQTWSSLWKTFVAMKTSQHFDPEMSCSRMKTPSMPPAGRERIALRSFDQFCRAFARATIIRYPIFGSPGRFTTRIYLITSEIVSNVNYMLWAVREALKLQLNWTKFSRFGDHHYEFGFTREGTAPIPNCE